MRIRSSRGSHYCPARGCKNRGPFKSLAALKLHQNWCKAFTEEGEEAHEDWKRWKQTKRQRLEDEARDTERVLDGEEGSQTNQEDVCHASIYVVRQDDLHSVQDAPHFTVDGPSDLQHPEVPDDATSGGRGHRHKRTTAWKYVDMVPSGLSARRQRTEKADDVPDVSGREPGSEGVELSQLEQQPELPPSPDETRVHNNPEPTAITSIATRIGRAFHTLTNAFGLSREYREQPVSLENNPATPASETPGLDASDKEPSVSSIISPYPTLSVFRFVYLHSCFTRLSQSFLEAMQDLITRDDFIGMDLKGVTLSAMKEKLLGTCLPWGDATLGWRKGSVKINIPDSNKSKGSKKRGARSSLHDQSSSGVVYDVDDFWYRPIIPLLKSVLTSGESSSLHYEPYVHWWRRPGSNDPPVRVYDELFTADAWLEEHKNIQDIVLPPDELDEYPRAIAALMFWSDSTHLAEFGQATAWPIYMALGNQSKYDRLKPGARAMHHLAYLPSLRKKVEEFILGTTASKTVTPAMWAHCRRELFHGAWLLLLRDPEFLKAYIHGIIITCSNGIIRRIFPRIFTYSADYPEKVLIATIRDMGDCPCPCCLVNKTKISLLGTIMDMRNRVTKARHDNEEYRSKIRKACEIIYDQHYVVSTAAVSHLLQPESLVPIENAFSTCLSGYGFNFFQMLRVDFLHEVELGLLKSTFIHLIRMLYSLGDDRVRTLNWRYTQVPSFGSSGSAIRSFTDNVSEMKKLAARDFEDILQCSIPCFEGLFLEDHNQKILELLYTILSWHGLAKLRLHTEVSLNMLREETVRLGRELRHFQKHICIAYETYETPREVTHRIRAALSRQQSVGRTSNTNSISTKKRRTFNLNTSKLHALGDYVSEITAFGTTDNYSTQSGEHKHRRVKARYRLTSKKNPTQQIIRRGAFEHEMRLKANALRNLGIDIPYAEGEPRMKSSATDRFTRDGQLHMQWYIAADQSSKVDLHDLINSGTKDDPAFQRFVPRLKDHILARLSNIGLASEDLVFRQEERDQLIIENDIIYQHATAQFNFTTYDVQQERDVIKPLSDKCDIIIATKEDESLGRHPFWYARVLGVYHARVSHLPSSNIRRQRIEFLFVRWFGLDPEWNNKVGSRQLHRVGFVPFETDADSPAFGFVDPATVIRGCQMIPAFSEMKTVSLLPPSRYRDTAGDYVNFYVNRFVTQDIMMWYIGFGVGHVDPTVRANPGWPTNNQSISEIIQQADIGEELTLEDDAYEVQSDTSLDIDTDEDDTIDDLRQVHALDDDLHAEL